MAVIIEPRGKYFLFSFCSEFITCVITAYILESYVDVVYATMLAWILGRLVGLFLNRLIRTQRRVNCRSPGSDQFKNSLIPVPYKDKRDTGCSNSTEDAFSGKKINFDGIPNDTDLTTGKINLELDSPPKITTFEKVMKFQKVKTENILDQDRKIFRRNMYPENVTPRQESVERENKPSRPTRTNIDLDFLKNDVESFDDDTKLEQRIEEKINKNREILQNYIAQQAEKERKVSKKNKETADEMEKQMVASAFWSKLTPTEKEIVYKAQNFPDVLTKSPIQSSIKDKPESNHSPKSGSVTRKPFFLPVAGEMVPFDHTGRSLSVDNQWEQKSPRELNKTGVSNRQRPNRYRSRNSSLPPNKAVSRTSKKRRHVD